MRSTSSDERMYTDYFGDEGAERRQMERELREEAEIDKYIEERGSGLSSVDGLHGGFSRRSNHKD